jgi:hypothetical protein
MFTAISHGKTVSLVLIVIKHLIFGRQFIAYLPPPIEVPASAEVLKYGDMMIPMKSWPSRLN